MSSLADTLKDLVSSKTVLTCATGALASLAAGYFLGRQAYKRELSRTNAFVLVVNLTFKSREAMNQFIKRWSVLADYCLEHEPNTLSYELSVSETQPDTVIIFERYRTRSDLTDVHNHSKPFREMQAWLGARDILMEKSTHEYMESNVGYMVK